jgi:uncharacterized membrane protein YtjA (UPF0391 family)
MLKWAATFLVISLIAAMFGFTNIAGSALDIAKVLFGIFLFIAIALFVSGLFFFGTKS